MSEMESAREKDSSNSSCYCGNFYSKFEIAISPDFAEHGE